MISSYPWYINKKFTLFFDHSDIHTAYIQPWEFPHMLHFLLELVWFELMVSDSGGVSCCDASLLGWLFASLILRHKNAVSNIVYFLYRNTHSISNSHIIHIWIYYVHVLINRQTYIHTYKHVGVSKHLYI